MVNRVPVRSVLNDMGRGITGNEGSVFVDETKLGA